MMGQALRHNLERAGLRNVRIVPQRAEDALASLEGPFDLALASHSLYNVLPVDQVVQRAVELAERVVILMGTGDRREWYDRLYRALKGRPPVSPAHFGDFYPVLLEMGLYADVEIVPTSANYVFETEQELVDWWARHFGVAVDDTRQGAEEHPILAGTLLRLAQRRPEGVGIFESSRAALITIHRAKSLFGDHRAG